jgi:hypothetical protein
MANTIQVPTTLSDRIDCNECASLALLTGYKTNINNGGKQSKVREGL